MNVRNDLCYFRISGSQPIDLPVGIERGGVVAFAKMLANDRRGFRRKLAGKIHRDMAGDDDLAITTVADHVADRNRRKLTADRLLNVLDRWLKVTLNLSVGYDIEPEFFHAATSLETTWAARSLYVPDPWQSVVCAGQ